MQRESSTDLAYSIPVEKTLALIKPDAIHRADEIIEVIKSNGFTIVQVRIVTEHNYFKVILLKRLQKRRTRLTVEQAADFYSEHYGKMFFASLVAFVHSNDIMALVLAKPDAIAEWRALIGPTDARRAKVQ